jgi:hypothetical protein
MFTPAYPQEHTEANLLLLRALRSAVVAMSTVSHFLLVEGPL